MAERIFNSSEDGGVGFFLTETQFHALGEKHAQILSVHNGKGGVKRVNPEAEYHGMLPETAAWYKRRSFDPNAK